jgi:hypothetical protein
MTEAKTFRDIVRKNDDALVLLLVACGDIFTGMYGMP